MAKAGVGGMLYALSLVLILLNFLFFPVVVCLLAIIQGYLITATHDAVTDEQKTLPAWKNWGELAIAGLTSMAIESLQLIVFAGIMLLALAFTDVASAQRLLSDNFVMWAILLWSIFVVLAALVSFFSAYRLTNFAAKQEIGAAFDFAEVFRRFRRAPLPLLQAWLLQVGLLWLAVILPCATIIGVFLLPSTYFASQIVSARILAQAWRLTEPKPEA
jgi:hypothetical protein